ncbi:hypothetical protein L596_020194 [Steinernema carpocapsae]|uniref:CSD1 domain-containing protein n=1 Tax=Steinernema carpocapsae TaxID=34508 RepID=A0A4U5MTG5_STECR|nr:hypothetical protein L596_020194 [Steinernema carpocapsae]
MNFVAGDDSDTDGDSTLSFYSSRSRSLSTTSCEYASFAEGSEGSEISERWRGSPKRSVAIEAKPRWRYECRSFWSDESESRSISQDTIEDEDVPKIALSKLLSTGEVLKHPISFRDLLALANHASRNVFKGHKFQRDDLINVTEHVGALSIQSVFTVAVKYQQYIVGLQRQRPEHILKTYERPALPPGFDCFHARSSLDRNENRFPFYDRCVDWYCVPLHVYQRIVKETLIQMFDKAQFLKERRKVEKQQKEKQERKLLPCAREQLNTSGGGAGSGAGEMPEHHDEGERTQSRRPRARNQVLNDEPPAKKVLFAEYWTDDVVKRGIQSGELFQGVIRINPRNYEESYIPNPLGDTFNDIAILGMHDRNRALNGDTVVYKIKDRSTWIVKQGQMKPQKTVEEQLKHSIRQSMAEEEMRREKCREEYLDQVKIQISREAPNVDKKIDHFGYCKKPVLKNTFTQKFVDDLPLSHREQLPDRRLQKTAMVVAISARAL